MAIICRAVSSFPGTELECKKLEVHPCDIKLGMKLGRGAFGTMYEALWFGSNVAVKVIDINQHPGARITPEREIAVLLLAPLHCEWFV